MKERSLTWRKWIWSIAAGPLWHPWRSFADCLSWKLAKDWAESYWRDYWRRNKKPTVKPLRQIER